MQVRHNTSLLEEAIAHVAKQAAIPALQAEAAAFRDKQRAIALRRLLTGVAVALAAIGLGWGLHLAINSEFSLGTSIEPLTSVAEASPSTSVPANASSIDPAPSSAFTTPPPIREASAIVQGPIITDYTKFNTQDTFLFGRTWSLETGQHFVNENDAVWDHGWCYSNQDAEGIQVKLDLADRQGPGSAPVGLIATTSTLEKVGLTDAQAVQLATHCPWLDRKAFSYEEIDLARKVAFASSSEPSTEPLSKSPGSNLAYEQFGSFASVEEANAVLPQLRNSWASYFPFGELAIQPVKFGSNEIRYNIRASVPTIDRARGICGAISQTGGNCFPALY